MNRISRRSIVAASMGIQAEAIFGGGGPEGEPVGTVPARHSRSISSSALSIGFETLDRQLFDPEKCYDAVGRLGVKYARVQTGWARTEREKGKFDFDWLDTVVDGLLSRGVQPWFNVTYGNRLYTPEAPLESAVGWVPLRTAEAREGWVRFVSNLCRHFHGRVKHWEIWNEPNAPTFWKPEPVNPAQYADLVALTAPVIRQRVPGAIVIGGAFGGIPRVFDYLEGCLASGMGRHLDKVSFHPYRRNPDLNYESDVRALRAVLKRHSVGASIWQGECGSPSAPGGVGALSEFSWTESRQAKWLLRRVLLDLSLEIELSSYFHIADMANYGEVRGRPGVAYWGLLRVGDYGRKPSYSAFQCLCSLFDSATSRADFVVDINPLKEPAAAPVEGVFTTSFVRHGRPLYVYWYPSDLMTDFAPTRVSALFWCGSAARLNVPVVIDPLSNRVFKPAGFERAGGFWRAGDLPLTDYPLIVTDETVVSALGGAPEP